MKNTIGGIFNKCQVEYRQVGTVGIESPLLLAVMQR